MAYAKKFTIPFKQIKGYDSVDGWIIDIYKEGHGGASTELYTERDSITLKRDGGQFEWVNGSKLSFELFNLTEEQYIEFRTAAFGDYYCNLKREDGTLVWRGYLQSEIYTEAYDQPPYTAKMEFTCGLNHLKYVRFQDGATLYSGQKSLIEVIRLCLNKLDVPLSLIREFVNVYDDSMTSTTTSSMLNQTFVDSGLYKEEQNGVEVGFTCHRVLEEIFKCFNCHIFQYDVTWQIIRWQEYSDATMYYREFDANVGSESTITVDGTGSFTTNKRVVTGVTGLSTELILNNQSELSVEPPLNRIQLTYNQESQDMEEYNIVKNGCLDSFTPNNYTGKPNYWTFTGVDPDTYDAMSPSGFNFDDLTSSAYVSTKYMSQSRANLYVNSTDSLLISFTGYQRLNITASSNANYNDINGYLLGQWLRVYPFQVKVGSYYLQLTGSNYGVWTTTPTICYASEIGSSNQMSFWQTNFITGIKDAFGIQTATLPETGFKTVEMTMFQPYSNVEPTDTNLTYFAITIEEYAIKCMRNLYKPAQTSVVTDYVVYQQIDEDEEVLNLEIMHGDGLYDFSLNSFRLSNGTVTDNWNRRGLTDNLSIFNMILKQYAELRGSFVYNLSATIYAQMSPYNTIQHTVNGTDYHYWITDYEYKLETNEWKCNLMQIENFTSITPDITTTFRYVEEPDFDTPTDPLIDTNNSLNIIEDSTNTYMNSNPQDYV